MSGAAMPGDDDTFAGMVVSWRFASSVLSAPTKRLYAAMPTSDEVVAPSSFLPKIATISGFPSSQILL